MGWLRRTVASHLTGPTLRYGAQIKRQGPHVTMQKTGLAVRLYPCTEIDYFDVFSEASTCANCSTSLSLSRPSIRSIEPRIAPSAMGAMRYTERLVVYRTASSTFNLSTRHGLPQGQKGAICQVGGFEASLSPS
jgi:hypothetical protein